MRKPTDLAAPSKGSTDGYLRVRRGLGYTAVTTAAMADLYTARCTGRRPKARVHGGTVELTYPRLSLRRPNAPDVITLNGAIPWRIDVAGSVGDVAADLTGVDLRAMAVDGGVARTHLDLPTPRATLPMQLGAVSRVTILRPKGVAVRVNVRRGATGLSVDDQRLGAVGGPTTIATPDFATATKRIDIDVDAADRLTITAA